jgi:hypothetical protein
MNSFCDNSMIDSFLPRIAEQIGKLAVGTPRYSDQRATEVTSTAAARSV